MSVSWCCSVLPWTPENVPVKKNDFNHLKKLGRLATVKKEVVYGVLWGLTGFDLFLFGFTEFHWILLDFTGFYWVLLASIGFY